MAKGEGWRNKGDIKWKANFIAEISRAHWKKWWSRYWKCKSWAIWSRKAFEVKAGRRVWRRAYWIINRKKIVLSVRRYFGMWQRDHIGSKASFSRVSQAFPRQLAAQIKRVTLQRCLVSNRYPKTSWQEARCCHWGTQQSGWTIAWGQSSI